jgi:hypothetical protein
MRQKVPGAIYSKEFRIASKLRQSRVKLGKFGQNQEKICGYAVKMRKNCENQKNRHNHMPAHEKFGQLRQAARLP